MKRKIYCAGIMLLALSTTLAQQPTKKASVEFSLGASIPFADYANGETASMGKHIKGFAKTGEAINISYYAATKHKIGLALMFAGQRNPLNTKSLEEKYAKTPFGGLYIGSVFPPPPPTPQYYNNWEFDKKAWYAASLLVGGYTDFAINKDGSLSLTMKAGVGPAYVSSPQYKGVSQSDTMVVSMFQSQYDAFGFSYSIVPGLSYQIKEGALLTFSVAYFGTAGMSFNDVKTSGTTIRKNGTGDAMSTWSYTSDMDQSVQSINISVGIRLKM